MNTAITNCVARSRMNCRGTRGEYCAAATCSATIVTEKAIVTTVSEVVATISTRLRAPTGPPVVSTPPRLAEVVKSSRATDAAVAIAPKIASMGAIQNARWTRIRSRPRMAE